MSQHIRLQMLDDHVALLYRPTTERESATPRTVTARLPATALACTLVLAAIGVSDGAPGRGARPAVHAQAARIYLPALRIGWPMTVCSGAMTQADAIERARSEAAFEGLGPPPGEERPRVIAADRLTAAEYDARFADADAFALLEGHFPVPPPWACYWRIDLAGDGWFQGSRPGSGRWRVNQFLTVFPDPDCRGCVGFWSIQWQDDPTATPAVRSETPTAVSTW